ncbi:ArnT family glycosyltransferase [Synechococcus sp. W4D4]|uniref:ArnT family glycosyltransferase n=1 Tax=Synechococcus sp. W4D4 TaxID=3392294 RepID=UPI0039EA1BDA
MISVAPRSYLAHDEGYYALQARWIHESGQWLAPLWWDQPLFDRTIGVQWLIASAQTLFGPSSWAAHLPSLLAAGLALWITARLASRLLGPGLGWLSAAVLALTPLFTNYAHLASQDMPLLALELLGVLALLQAQPQQSRGWHVAAGIWLGPAFLVKGFMTALPVLALLPLLLLRRRFLLRSAAFWSGLLLGWLPVGLWLGLSLQHYGAGVVGGLLDKLLFLSESDVYSAGPLYYFWNIPANCAPWSLPAIAGLVWGLKRWRSEQGLVLLVYPLSLLLLLSCFRTKTPYYGLQLTPFLAIWAASGLRLFAQSGIARPRAIAWCLAGLGVLLSLAGVLLLVPGNLLNLEIPPLAPALVGLAALVLGLSWALLPQQKTPKRVVAAVLIGPWLALSLLVQGGLFSDRSPAVRQALSDVQLQALLAAEPVAVISESGLSGQAHAQLILVALGTPQLGPKLENTKDLAPGALAWIEAEALQDSANRDLIPLASGDDLAPWTLVRSPSGN